ncbi:hypothetical protein RI129_000973 [Pyrocoelia pectoralis]|uniref:Uncharacterized protein n=1 Tax=Pyrocoelia pectoralis TaxID=417401 RepID=A0AAN7VSY5_9COLE
MTFFLDDQKYQIDVVCWRTIAKIYTLDGHITLKTRIKDDLSWIPISITHVFNDLDVSDILNLHTHTINYTLMTNESKLGKSKTTAKKEKCKIFFIKEKDLESSEKFALAYEFDPNTMEHENNENILRCFIQSILWECVDKPGKSFDKEVVTKLQFLEGGTKNCSNNSNQNKNKGDSALSHKEEKKKGNNNNKEGDEINIKVSGEVLYTDPDLSIYNLSTPSYGMGKAYILTSISHLLTGEIYIRYSIPHIAQCSSIVKPLKQNITFNEAHAHFLQDVPKLKFLEFMQTGKFIVEVLGCRDQDIRPLPTLFGCKVEDADTAKTLAIRNCKQTLQQWKIEPCIVTLAVACFNVSALFKTYWNFVETASCHHPDTLLYKKNDYTKLDYSMATINNINLEMLEKPISYSPLTEDVLSTNGTLLEIEIQLSAPSNAILELYCNNSSYNRLFALFKRYELAEHLLHVIMLHNQDVLGPEVLVTNYLKSGVKETYKELYSDLYNDYNRIVTGFIIFNGDNCILFIEASSNGLVSYIWSLIKDNSRPEVRIFYNSDFCFERRIYSDLIQYGGVYTISLKIPLDDILNQYLVYLEGSMPLPCWEALKKLNILIKSNTMRSMVYCSLFPTSREILSLDMEFGVPYQWDAKENFGRAWWSTSIMKNVKTELFM